MVRKPPREHPSYAPFLLLLTGIALWWIWRLTLNEIGANGSVLPDSVSGRIYLLDAGGRHSHWVYVTAFSWHLNAFLWWLVTGLVVLGALGIPLADYHFWLTVKHPERFWWKAFPEWWADYVAQTRQTGGRIRQERWRSTKKWLAGLDTRLAARARKKKCGDGS